MAPANENVRVVHLLRGAGENSGKLEMTGEIRSHTPSSRDFVSIDSTNSGFVRKLMATSNI